MYGLNNKGIALLGVGLIPLCGCNKNTGRTTAHDTGTPPNILFCIADDASFPHFGAYGCRWVSTPGFDRVAREGILFTNAYTPNAKSGPSRSCILTGRNSWQLEEAANHISNFPAKFLTFMEVLRKNGYFTGYTAKGWAPGNPGTVDGKPRELTGQNFTSVKKPSPSKGISNDDYSANFRDFLDAKPDTVPWCFWYGGREPHRVYQYGSGVSLGGKQTGMIDKVPMFWPDNDTVRNDMLDYAFEIEHFDSHLAMMLAELEKRGELSNTLVVVTSDNGMPFPRCKGIQYEYSNHMPLAVMWLSGIKNPGRIADDYISFIDFAPTFLDLARISSESSGMASSPGKSFTDILADSKERRSREFILLGQERHDYGRPDNQGYPVRSVLRDGYLYQINFKPDLWPAGNPETGYLNTDGSPTKTVILNLRRQGADRSYWEKCFGKHPSEELYYIPDDPECLKNLVMDPLRSKLRDEMKQILTEQLIQQQDPRINGKGDVFDHYPFDDPACLNFYERFMNGQIKKYQTGWVNPDDYEPVPFIER